DSLTVVGSALADSLPKLLDLISDVAMNASFPANEVNLYKQNREQGLQAARSQPAFLAQEKTAQAVYGSSPYAHISPTLQPIGKLDAKMLAGYRDTYLIPNNATLILLGKMPARAELM